MKKIHHLYNYLKNHKNKKISIVLLALVSLLLSNISHAQNATITADDPGCTLSIGEPNCTTFVTWNRSNAPNSGVFIGNNTAYWTGTPGTKNFIWTQVISTTLYVRLNKFDSSSQILAQIQLRAATAPSATITASSPGCTLPAGTTTCTTAVTWNFVNAPNAGVFIDNNSVYWTGTPGTKNFIWTRTTSTTLYVRLDKNDVSSQILDQINIVAAPAVGATATIEANNPGCILSLGASTCTTAVSWTRLNAPNAGIFVANNPTYWTGTPGTKNFIWTRITATTLYVRLDKNDASSQILAQINIVAAPAAGATASINANNPGCTLPLGASTCTTAVSWSRSNAPNAGIFIANNPTYWTGTPGTKNFIWTRISATTLYVRLDKNDASSQILDQISIRAAATPVPSATISASYPGCLLAVNATTCTSAVTWSRLNAPNSALFIANNQDYWQDAPGNYSFIWASTSPQKLRVRLDKNNPSSQILDEIDLVAAEPTPARFSGGSSYRNLNYGPIPQGCAWEKLGLVKHYDAQVVSDQLMSMYLNGMRSLKISFHYDVDDRSYGAVVPLIQLGSKRGNSYDYGIANVYLDNISEILAETKNVGFERIIFTMMSNGKSDPEKNLPGTVNPYTIDQLTSQAISLWKQVMPLVEDSGLNFYLDVWNEGIPYNSLGFNAFHDSLFLYARSIWSKFRSDPYLSRFNDRSYMSMIAKNKSHIRRRGGQMRQIFGGDFPQFYDFHLYNNYVDPNGTPEDEGVVVAELLNLIETNGYPDLPWIIGETFYNDGITATKLGNALVANGKQIEFLIQWPRLRGDEDCPHHGVGQPYFFEEYEQAGF